jgi:membrane-associated phospholipid phosphatase
VIAITQTGYSLFQALLWTLLAIMIVNVPMGLLVFKGIRSGRYSDPSISIREQRNNLYILGAASLLALLLLLIVGKAPAVLTACLVSAFVATGFGFVINRLTKLSIHSAAMAGCAAVLLWTMPIFGAILAIFAPFVGWARIRLKHHTPAQILIGWIVPSVCVFIVFRLML